ncbi:acetolactate synthase-1/2/3 large subunit [Thermosporothrix hazakensis]|jgi:acetolactate synthase-1/2/3 large subunit|uniref:Acetolactate synthase-1/2/3 large subunit n=1 Tax=Thermosporothrix hazakensis TaxID=644383 RepID=A0A326U7P7_THEHA|nr:thiamine pyrophosphate-binding protein [Thermosporothrix hazakensis]PZW29478.1 acetolactate synthase-1/2/3 large subunit [Thermosporothrix hazakensis]GCE45807.1 acetolactate synthase [Thermosporothrix hazakensis]
MNTAQVLVELLKAYKVQHIFGVPGDTTMHFYDALYAARDDIQHIMARDERSAAFMADTYARLSHRPGITEAPSGGGATYVIPGIAEANGSSVPMIVFTSDVPVVDEGKGTLTAIDQARLLEAATKWRGVVKRPSMLPDIVQRAFRAATTGRGGVAHIVLPEDVLGEELPSPALHAEEACTVYPAYRTQAPRVALEAILDALLKASRPLIIAGGGAVLSGAWDEITALAERLHIPVATTINGKGSINEMHPWSVGVIGGNGARPYANQLMAEADCIFYLGSKVNSLTTLKGTVPAPTATVLQLNVDPLELGNNVPATVAACGDIKESLAALLELISQRSISAPQRSVTPEKLEELAAPFWEAVARNATRPDVPVVPQRIIETLWQHTPEDVVVVADPGTMTPFTASQFRTRRPGRSVVIPRAHGGLGYALPATVGAYYARPGERIVGLVGDGSFGMSGTELATIGMLKLPITLIHFNNGSFGWIKMLQHLYYGQRYLSVDFTGKMDAATVAEGFGVRGIRITHPDQLVDAITEGLASNEPVFIDVHTRSELDEVPPVHAWQQALSQR